MDFLQTLIGFCVALFILVSVHEFGHFYVARRCGVKVLRFCVGLGKPVWSVRDRHGTEFGIAAIPLGGYVKMLDEREVDVPADQKHLSYNSKSVWQRIAILAAGPMANFLLAIFVFWGIAAFKGSIGISPVVAEVIPDSPAAQAGIEAGHQIVAVDGSPTPTRQAVYERLLGRLGESGVVQILVSAPGSDLQESRQVRLQEWMRGATDPDPAEGLGVTFFRPAAIVADVVADSPAAAAGLQKDDELKAVDGESITSLNSWIDYVRARPGQIIELEVLRDGDRLTLSVTPAGVTADDGATFGQVGVQVTESAWPEDMIIRQNFGMVGSLVEGARKTWQTSGFVLMSLKKLVVGEISTKNLSGPIGIAKVAGDHARAGIPYFIEFLAILSIYLGVLNLLPIPILDGGHILYCLVEAVKGSPVSERIQVMGYSAGLMLLAGVMVLAFYNDILRLY